MKRREFLTTSAVASLLPLAPQPLVQGAEQPQQKTGSSNEFSQSLHPDFITFVDGIEYFHLGNGEILAVLQYSPKEATSSFFGMTFWDSEIFARKWSTFLYHPERGLANTRVSLTLNELVRDDKNTSGEFRGVKGYAVNAGNFESIRWGRTEGVPSVILRWKAGPCAVQEEFFVPSRGALLFRKVTVTNAGSAEVEALASVYLYANFGLFDRIGINEEDHSVSASGLARMKLFSLTADAESSGRYELRVPLKTLAPQEARSTTFVYAIQGAESVVAETPAARLMEETQTSWADRSTVTTGHPRFDHLFDISRSGLRAAVSRTGRMDGGIWMYNMEWLFDQVFASEALLRCGFVEEARIMLERNIVKNVGVDGRTTESSRWYGFDYTELNQNGGLLAGIWNYVCWTGDLDLARRHWEKIRLCGDFPLTERFLNPAVHMVHNKREFWERNDREGVLDGYELAYQFWVAHGLAKGSEVAHMLGDTATRERWRAASKEIQAAMLTHPQFRLIENGHLIKRRTVDGRWQRYFVPPDRSLIPSGSPLATGAEPDGEPDTVTVFPIFHEMIDPRSELARSTLAWVDRLWNQRWSFGGYPRYNTSSEPDPPAPWPIASLMVARAYLESGDDSKVWRVLDWLYSIHGGLSGGWFERYGPSITPPAPPVNIVPWVWYELVALAIHHVAGVRPGLDSLRVRPRLLSGLDTLKFNGVIRGANVTVQIERTTGTPRARVDGKSARFENGSVVMPYPARGMSTTIEVWV